MKETNYLASSVDVLELAKKTRNFSGAELAGLVTCATSYGLSRELDDSLPPKPIDPSSVKVY